MAGEAGAGRCPWAGEDPLYVRYHDEEWGVPVRDRVRLFEKLCLEGQQAGLSWITVLRKRERYRERFYGFEPTRVVRIDGRGIESRLKDAGLIRHRGKLEAIVKNAKACLKLEDQVGDFGDWVWGFVGAAPWVNRYKTMAELPAKTDASTALSKALKRAGFGFVGPTTCYAMMQACGLVNDHLVGCPRHAACTKLK